VRVPSLTPHAVYLCWVRLDRLFHARADSHFLAVHPCEVRQLLGGVPLGQEGNVLLTVDSLYIIGRKSLLYKEFVHLDERETAYFKILLLNSILYAVIARSERLTKYLIAVVAGNQNIQSISTTSSGLSKRSLLYLKLHRAVDFLLVETPMFAYEPISECLQEIVELPLIEELFLIFPAHQTIIRYLESVSRCEIYQQYIVLVPFLEE
jgi:hypothetical protein